DDLYSECKLYLTDKIESNNYQNEFVDAAYQVILMCEANLMNYNHAMDGYEFIINFHPDPIVRINASWDYEDLESLLGQGGAERSNEQTEEEYKTKKLKKLLKRINNDPLKQQILSKYDKKVTKEYNLLTKEIKNTNERITKTDLSLNDRKKIEQKIYNSTDQKIIQKSIENVMKAGSRTEEEKQKSLIEDLVMSSGIEIHTDNNVSGEIIPNEYRLNQNYPNPF
ncbi:MAG TPA: hypothetical protein DEP28_12510, partial [Bacteroidetes bacterium]|nr:hypothetical protein [Bacteroidota bacterium]